MTVEVSEQSRRGWHRRGWHRRAGTAGAGTAGAGTAGAGTAGAAPVVALLLAALLVLGPGSPRSQRNWRRRPRGQALPAGATSCHLPGQPGRSAGLRGRGPPTGYRRGPGRRLQCRYARDVEQRLGSCWKRVGGPWNGLVGESPGSRTITARATGPRRPALLLRPGDVRERP